MLGLPADDDDALRILMGHISPPNDGTIYFVEERDSVLFSKSFEVKGYLRYFADGSLEKVIESPSRRILRLGPDRVSIESGAKKVESSISNYPVLAGLRAGIVGIVRRDSGALSAVFEATIEEPADGWRVYLVPRDVTVRRSLPRLVLRGCGSDMTSVQLWLNDGTVEEMHFVPKENRDPK